MKEFLKQSALNMEIDLSDDKIEKFSIYYNMLIETNKSLNLTAITEMHEVVLKHFIDSISISKYFDFENKHIIDVGTGAGFPGIPLAIMFPNSQFVLLDSLKKRLNFIDEVIKTCDIKNVSLIHGRAEDYGRDIEYREKFDYCVSRAVASLPILLELCSPFVKVNGKFISYKSEHFKNELNDSSNAMFLLKCKLEKEISYTIPNTDFYRVFAIFNKNEPLSKKYPRQAGKPKKSPL